MPTPAQYAYLAGVMDSDGYFYGGGKSNSFGLRVVVVDEVLIQHLHETFGGNVSNQGFLPSGKERHVWYLQAQEPLREVCVAMRPHLTIKKNQNEALIDLIDHLQSAPKYDTPTSRASREERARRRRERVAFEDEKDRLRDAIVEARRLDRPHGKSVLS